MRTSSELLNDCYERLNKLSSDVFYLEYEDIENSLDFIMDGTYKKPRCISLRLDIRAKIEILVVNCMVQVEFHANIADFTLSGPRHKHVIYTLDVPEDFELNNVCFSGMMDEINSTKKRIVRKAIPSSQLAMICGPHNQKRYEILDSVSKHLIKNRLVQTNGHILIDPLMAPMFPKNTLLVNELSFFDTLRTHSKLIEK